MTEVTIPVPDDFHVHFRAGAMLRTVVPETAKHFGRALVMPNVPAIEDADAAGRYRREIVEAAGDPRFTPLMTIKLTHRTTPEMIIAAKAAGVVAAKLYPEGATTASHDGIRDVRLLGPVLAAMADCGMVLCVHGEEPSAFVLDRECEYLATVGRIAVEFPTLRIVLEHVTTAQAVRFVAYESENLAATITAHHLIHTLDDVLGSGIRPHHFCYPVPKRPADRAILRKAAAGRYGDRFFFGSDTAPHLRGDKQSACGCAGVFSAPVALSVVADVLLGDDPDESDVTATENFLCRNGARFYGLAPNPGRLVLRREPWTAPEAIDGVVPLWAGREAAWKVTGRLQTEDRA